MDSQTRVEHTLAIAALIQAMVKELAEHYEEGKELSRYPYEMLDENKWLAARHGLDGSSSTCPTSSACPCRELARRLIDRLRPHAEELGSDAEFDLLEDIARQRQRRIAPVAGLRGQPRPPGGRARDDRRDGARGGRGARRGSQRLGAQMG